MAYNIIIIPSLVSTLYTAKLIGYQTFIEIVNRALHK